MKKAMRKIASIVLTCVIVLSCCTYFTNEKAYAAAPKLNVSKKTIYEKGTTYQLKVKNKPAGASYAWSSSKESVATVNGLGMVTAMKKGNTVITCIITYKDKTVTKLTCNVTVKISATKVEINNAKEIEHIHFMNLGDTYDFNRTLTPKGSSDKTYWVVEDPDILSVDANGVVTALAIGRTRLYARTGATKAKAMDNMNPVTDAIMIEVIEVQAEVQDVKLESAKVVSVTFSHAMNSSSLVTSYGYITSNVIIEGKTTEGKVAAAPGSIQASLSSDGKVLKLTAANAWNGKYNLKIESDVLTQSGVSFKGYDEDLNLSDAEKPRYIGTTVDDTGMIASINFSEPVDITNLQPIRMVTSVGLSTKYVLTTLTNYKLSEDKCSVTIDLSLIDTADRNKSISFNISGIKDLQGNYTDPYTNTVYVLTDTSTKANASLVKVERSSKNIVTAIFSSSIQTPGYMSISGTLLTGMVDTSNRKKVNFTLTDAIASSTSTLSGYVYGWCSYNSTTYGGNTNFTVDMSAASAAPQLAANTFSSFINNGTVTNTLNLAFNKPVSLVTSTGNLTATYSSYNGDVTPYNIAYTATCNDKEVTIILDSKNTSAVGYYTIAIPSYFVYDSYGNYNSGTSVVFSVTKTTTTPLPKPTSIIQTTNNRSVFQITFPTKVDPTTAQNPTNYSIDKLHPTTAQLITNSDSGAVVEVTFGIGTIVQSMYYPFTIENITGYANAYSQMETYSNYMDILENAAPVLESATLSSNYMVVLKFSENLFGNPSFNVIKNGAILPQSSCYISGDLVYIVLSSTVDVTNLTVSPTSNNFLTDENNNVAIIPSSRPVTY